MSIDEAAYIRALRSVLADIASRQRAWSNYQARSIVSNCLDHLEATATYIEMRSRVEHMEQILRDHHLTAGSPTNEPTNK